MKSINPVAWLLTDEKINSIQVKSIQRLIERTKHAHYTNVYLRINGQDEHHEADWLKHLTMNAEALEQARNDALDEAVMCCPGGSICDPQVIADAIRALKDKR